MLLLLLCCIIQNDDNRICFKDVVENFSCINVVLLSNPIREKGPTRGQASSQVSRQMSRQESMTKIEKVHSFNVSRETFWFHFSDKTSDEDSFGLETSMYKLQVNPVSEFFFSVHQKDKRVVDSPGYFDFGVTILKHNLSTDEFEFVASSGNSVERQLQCDVQQLGPGEYWVIPMSTGTKMIQSKDQAVKNQQKPLLRRSAGLVVHSLTKYTFEVVNKSEHPEELIFRAMECAVELPVTKSENIEKKDVYGDESLVICNLRSGYAGRSYAAINNTDLPKFSKKHFYEVTLDLSKSENVITYHDKSVSVIVAPGETEILNHAFPEGESATFTVQAKRTQRKLKKEEIAEYLDKNPIIKERLDQKGVVY